MLQVLAPIVLSIEYALKILAIGIIPENRNPSSSSSWLLLILFLPFVGFPLYWLIGSPWVRGRRRQIQDNANKVVADLTAHFPDQPAGVRASDGLATVLRMNRNLTGFPCVTGSLGALYEDTPDLIAAMADAVTSAESYVHVEFYILTFDETTAPLIDALIEASRRGVRVRVLADHLGSRKYSGWKELQRRFAEAKIQMQLMMPIMPLKGRWRRPDLRNHRKLLVVDGKLAFLGSHNLIDPAYGSVENDRVGRHWHDLSVVVFGEIVRQVDAVFVMDWFIESGELAKEDLGSIISSDWEIEGASHAFQLVPSGPGYPTEPNLRMFMSLIHMATRKVLITSPYFVPDEALLAAITTAAKRGLDVELFVGEKADQLLVGHAQRSFYRALLEAGVRIFLYPAPLVLHSKFLTIDDSVAVIGSSNMDYRSFALNYETMLLGFSGDLVDKLQATSDRYRLMSTELTLDQWSQEPLVNRYVDNVARLTAAVM